jgi:hypothetical protein
VAVTMLPRFPRRSQHSGPFYGIMLFCPLEL